MIKKPVDEATWQEMCVDEKIDAVCDAFEVAWTEGKSPKIADYATLIEKEARACLLRELMILSKECQEASHRTVRAPQETQLHSTLSLREGHIETDLEFLNGNENSELQSLELDLPANFGDYILLELLGRGSFGRVYRAENTRTGGACAIKIPHPTLVADPDDYKVFIRESRNVANLRHKGIVKVLNVEYEDRIPFLVSEFVCGKNLKELLVVTGKFPPELAAKFVKDLAETVDHAHQNGVIHRDIKPSNILVEDTLEITDLHSKSLKLTPRLLDFGIAKISGSNTLVTQPGVVLGTPAYMSPEQARGDSSLVTPRSDIYSLGTILYELLTGSPPFQGEASQIIEKARSEEVPTLLQGKKAIPKNLAIICQQALRLDPAARYASAADFADDLRRFLNDEPIRGKPITFSEWLSKKSKKHRSALVSTTIAVLLVVASVSLAWQRDHQNRNLVANLLVSDPKSHIGPATSSGLNDWLIHAPLSFNDAGPLLQAILNTGPDRLVKIGSALKPHRSKAVTMLQKAFDANEGDRSLQFRIACLRGVVDPQSFETLGVSNQLVDWLVDGASHDNVDGWVQLTNSFRFALIPWVVQRYRSSASEAHHAVAHKLLKGFLSQEPVEQTIDAIMASRVQELSEWKQLMERDTKRSLVALENRRLSLGAKFGVDRQGESDVAACANLLLMEYGLGKTDHIWPHLAITEDPRLRSYFVHQIPDTGFQLKPLTEHLFNASDASIQYAILVAISQCSQGELGEESVAKIQAWLREAYSSHPDCGVHGMCRWLLNHWGHRQFLQEIDTKLRGEGIVEGRNWYVNPLGMQMLLIRGPVEFMMEPGLGPRPENAVNAKAAQSELQPCRIPRAFAIGTDEVTVEQYQQFLASTKHDPKATVAGTDKVADGTHPVTEVTWLNAMNFCRWLSLETGVTESDASTLAEVDVDTIEVDYRKLGYRLPTRAEWEYGCRGATTTYCSYGTKNTPARELYAFEPNESWLFSPHGSYLPNVLGMFDCMGNAAEWVSTRISVGSKKMPSDSETEIFSLRAAVYVCGKRISKSSSSTSILTVSMPGKSSNSVGFRVAHTIAP